MHLVVLWVVQGAPNLRHHAFGNNWYDYRVHGEDWTMDHCASRTRQSPVDLYIPKGPPKGTLYYSYEKITDSFEIQNNGHAIATDLSNRGYGSIFFDDARYTLRSITFHSKSEHKIKGGRYPLEVHLVHQLAGGAAIAVVALLFDSPQDPRPEFNSQPVKQDKPADKALEFFALNLPNLMNITHQEATELDYLDLNPWMDNAEFLGYEGSLTAPPCRENVYWFVRKDPIPASNDQMQTFVTTLYRMTNDLGNYREPLPLMGREIIKYNVKKGEKIAEPPPFMKTTPEEREFKAYTDAQNALATARNHQDELKELDSTIRQAAVMHASALGGYPDLFPSLDTFPEPPPPATIQGIGLAP